VPRKMTRRWLENFISLSVSFYFMFSICISTVFMYPPGKPSGVVLFSVNSNSWINGIAVDISGNVYTYGKEYLRWVPGSGTTPSVINVGSSTSVTYRMRVDGQGNLYVCNQATVSRYNIINTIC
jgi:hypothetical protein